MSAEGLLCRQAQAWHEQYVMDVHVGKHCIALQCSAMHFNPLNNPTGQAHWSNPYANKIYCAYHHIKQHQAAIMVLVGA